MIAHSCVNFVRLRL